MGQADATAVGAGVLSLACDGCVWFWVSAYAKVQGTPIGQFLLNMAVFYKVSRNRHDNHISAPTVPNDLLMFLQYHRPIFPTHIGATSYLREWAWLSTPGAGTDPVYVVRAFKAE